jgi:hypothetical protein
VDVKLNEREIQAVAREAISWVMGPQSDMIAGAENVRGREPQR